MNCYKKSTLSAYNHATQTLAANTVIELTGSTRTGTSIHYNPTQIDLVHPGLYKVIFNANGVSGTGEVVVQLQRNGVAVNGASAEATLVAGDNTALNFSTIIDVAGCPCSLPVALTFVNDGVASIIEDVNITIEKIA